MFPIRRMTDNGDGDWQRLIHFNTEECTWIDGAWSTDQHLHFYSLNQLFHVVSGSLWCELQKRGASLWVAVCVLRFLNESQNCAELGAKWQWIIYLAQRSCSALRMPLAPHLNCMRQMQTNHNHRSQSPSVWFQFGENQYAYPQRTQHSHTFLKDPDSPLENMTFSRSIRKRRKIHHSDVIFNWIVRNRIQIAWCLGVGMYVKEQKRRLQICPLNRWPCHASDAQVEVQKTIIPCSQGNSRIMTYLLAIFVSERYAWVRQIHRIILSPSEKRTNS